MSNFTKDQPSIRVFAPPGGRSANIFGVPEPEPPMSTKKNHMESDIFGCKKDSTDSVPVNRQTRNMTNNIYGNEPEQTVQKSSIYSGKNKSTIFDEAPPPQQPSTKPDRQRSNIFGPNEPVQSASARPVSEKFKSNIFGSVDDDTQTKRQSGGRQGLRGRFEPTKKQESYRPSIAISLYSPLRLKDPNASRMGYNPINGESYSTKDGLNSKIEQLDIKDNEKELDETVKTSEKEEQQHDSENGHEKKEDEKTTGNGHHTQAHENAVNNSSSQASVEKSSNGHSNGANGHNNAKNAHPCVRVFQPPGGRSNGPLW